MNTAQTKTTTTTKQKSFLYTDVIKRLCIDSIELTKKKQRNRGK